MSRMKTVADQIARLAPKDVAEVIRAVADWGDRTQDHYYWGYDQTSEKLRALADDIEGGGTSLAS